MTRTPARKGWARRLSGGALLWAVLLSLTACAAQKRGPQSGGELFVSVRNDLIPPGPVTVWIVPNPGGRSVLGNVSPSSSRTFRFRPATSVNEYYLVAEVVDGRELQSRMFAVEAGDEIRWSVRTNTVDVVDP